MLSSSKGFLFPQDLFSFLCFFFFFPQASSRLPLTPVLSFHASFCRFSLPEPGFLLLQASIGSTVHRLASLYPNHHHGELVTCFTMHLNMQLAWKLSPPPTHRQAHSRGGRKKRGGLQFYFSLCKMLLIQ